MVLRQNTPGRNPPGQKPPCHNFIQGAFVQRGLCPGGILSRGDFVQGVLSRGGSRPGDLVRGDFACRHNGLPSVSLALSLDSYAGSPAA